MIRTKQLKLVDGRPQWVYGRISRNFQAGDLVQFPCSGRGRGGHFSVTARVDRVLRTTLMATEQPGSYSPGTPWRLRISPGDRDSILVELPAEIPADYKKG